MVLAEADGEITEVDGGHVVLTTPKGQNYTYNLNKFIRSNASTCIDQHPVVNVGEKVKKGQPLSDGPSIRHGELALGQNMLVAYMCWEGFNYEDAVIISERLVQENCYTSIHIEDYTVDVCETKLGPELLYLPTCVM
jgi:DNA-directed RNA polymerase subunit beta